MKRSSALRQLSRERRAPLSLALRIAKATEPAAQDRLLATVPALFRGELEPHFQEEEHSLLPQLAQAGETALVARTLDDHAQMRALAAAIAGGDTTALAPFGNCCRPMCASRSAAPLWWPSNACSPPTLRPEPTQAAGCRPEYAARGCSGDVFVVGDQDQRRPALRR